MAVLRLCGLLLLGMAAGCELARDPTGLELRDRPVAVYSVLRAGSDTVSVLLIRYRETFQLFDPGFDPIPGAEVRIVAGRDTLHLAADPEGVSRCFVAARAGERPIAPGHGCYTAVLPGGVRPSESYELRVRLPSGETIRGATRVPRAPRFLAPEANARLRPGAHGSGFVLRLGFEAPPEAGLVTLTLRAEQEICEISPEGETIAPGEPIPVGGPGADSATVRIRRVSCSRQGTPVQQDSVPARLLLTAYDTAYARYFNQVLGKQSVLRSRASAGVEGALGVFAGVASAERRIVFVLSR